MAGRQADRQPDAVVHAPQYQKRRLSTNDAHWVGTAGRHPSTPNKRRCPTRYSKPLLGNQQQLGSLPNAGTQVIECTTPPEEEVCSFPTACIRLCSVSCPIWLEDFRRAELAGVSRPPELAFGKAYFRSKAGWNHPWTERKFAAAKMFRALRRSCLRGLGRWDKIARQPRCCLCHRMTLKDGMIGPPLRAVGFSFLRLLAPKGCAASGSPPRVLDDQHFQVSPSLAPFTRSFQAAHAEPPNVAMVRRETVRKSGNPEPQGDW